MDKKLVNAGFNERRFNTGRLKINYVRGPNNGLALVLIPGQTASWENYEKVLIPLSKKFEVFVVDIRGHGKSDWATGDYSFKTIGADMSAFLKKVVKRPSIISGNSSGGLIAIWLAANLPKNVLAIIGEDPPLFSAEWPRIKKEFVYYVLKSAVEIAVVLKDSRSVKELSEVLQKIEKPIKGKNTARKLSHWITYPLACIIRLYQSKGKIKFISIPFIPKKFKQLIEVISNYDPDFSQAWVDGRIYQGLDHAKALKQVKCPMLLLHANWFRHPKYSLSGAMDNADVKHTLSLVPHCQYKRIDSEHVIHSDKPDEFVREIETFANQLRKELGINNS